MNAEIVEAWQSGDLTLEEAAAALVGAIEPPGTKRLSAVGVYEEAEDRDRSAPGTWGEIQSMWANGKISTDDYLALSAAVDAEAGRSGTTGWPPVS